MSTLLPLRVERLRFAAGGRDIVAGLSLVFEAGPRSVILGANGAGKSVLMRLLHGLLAPTSGAVGWNLGDRALVRRRQAMVFQRPVLLRRSAIDNVIYALAIAGVARGERVHRAAEALERVGLAAIARSPARVLSGGEQQRLALARVWALAPEVLFLDEPTASLDPRAAAEVESTIADFHAAGTKIIMSTHNLGQARRLADEILFLHEGRLAERAPAAAFFAGPRSAEAAAFLQGELP